MRIDHTDPDSITKCTRSTRATLLGLRNGMHRCTSHECCEPLDVRLVSNADGELWFATGDVRYDTVHGAACEAVTLSPDLDDDTVNALAAELVNGVADQLAEQEVE